LGFCQARHAVDALKEHDPARAHADQQRHPFRVVQGPAVHAKIMHLLHRLCGRHPVLPSRTKSPFSIPLICTGSRWSPATCSAHQGSRKRRFGRRFGRADAIWSCRKRETSSQFREQLLRRNVKRYRGGLVFKARRLLYHSTLGLRVINSRHRGVNGSHPRITSLTSSHTPNEGLPTRWSTRVSGPPTLSHSLHLHKPFPG